MQFSSGWTNLYNGEYPTINGMSYFGMEGEISKLTDKVCLQPLGSVRSIEEAYLKYSPLAAIILRISSMFVNGKFEILNRTTQNYTRGQYKEWDRLFLTPNELQTRTEFFTQLVAYILLQGYCYVRPKYASGFKDVPYSLEILLPWLLTVQRVNGKRKLTYHTPEGAEEELNEKDLILLKDTLSPVLDKMTYLPMSRVANLQYPLSNGIGAYESRNTLIYKRGAIGILSNTSNDVHGIEPIEESEKEDILNKFNYRYGLTRSSTSSVIVTDAALNWQSMVQSVKDLMLHDEHKACIKDICDIYGISHRLLSTDEGTTFANKSEDKKEAYNDTIMPLSASVMEQLNNGVDAINKNIEIIQSYEHLYLFQQSKEEQGKGIKAINDAMLIAWDNGIITRNMWLEQLEMDTIANPLFDKYKFELTPEELGIVVPENNNPPGNGTNNNN